MAVTLFCYAYGVRLSSRQHRNPCAVETCSGPPKMSPVCRVHFGVSSATCIASAPPLLVHQVGSVPPLRVAHLLDRLLRVAWPAQQLTLAQLILNPTLAPAPDPVVNLAVPINMIELKPVVATASNALSAMQVDVLQPALSYAISLVLALHGSVFVRHHYNIFGGPAGYCPRVQHTSSSTSGCDFAHPHDHLTAGRSEPMVNWLMVAALT